MKNLFVCLTIVLLVAALCCAAIHLLGKYFFPSMPYIDPYYMFGFGGIGMLAGFIADLVSEKRKSTLTVKLHKLIRKLGG